MGMRPQLILDIGGVLLSDLRPNFWQSVASRWNVRNLEEEFVCEFKQSFWTGMSSVDSIYAWIDAKVGISDVSGLMQEIAVALQALPSFDLLPHWSTVCDLHILSNHRTQWVTGRFGAAIELFKSITISDTVGYCKPDPAIFEIVQAKIKPGADVYYVDDHEKNLRIARSLGWFTILADKKGSWLLTLDRALNAGRTSV